MANLGRRWKRVMAIGCTHGDFMHPQAYKDAMEFRRRFQPQVRFHLGDLIDATCFRSGAAGSKDEFKRPHDDMSVAARIIEEYEPTHLTWGNHDWRLYELMDHPKALVSTLAGQLWHDLNSRPKKLKCRTVDYDVEDGWLEAGGYLWGHGYEYNMQALRDTAEANGMPTVMAHLHYAHQSEGRTRKGTPSYCVGTLADERKLKYARRRRKTLQHCHGLVYGEMTDKETHLWLVRSDIGKPMHFPPGI